MGPSPADLVLITALLAGHGLFSLAEIALISSRRARLQEMAEDGHHGARVALELTEEPELFLALVQVGIVTSAILIGMLGGIGLAPVMGAALAKAGLSAGAAPGVGFALTLLLLVLLEILVGELVPRRIAARSPEGVVSLLAPPMRLLAAICSPLLRAVNGLAGIFAGMLGLGASASQPTITEEEVNRLIQEGTQAGVFHEAEQEIVARVLRLGDRRINHLMTPRTDVVWLSAEATIEENLRRMAQSGYSNFPVCHKSVDNVLGVVSIKDVWRTMFPAVPSAPGAARGHARPGPSAPPRLRDLLQEPLIVPEGTTVIRVLDKLRESHRQFAIVVDEYGGLAGVVTDHDILEAVVGEMLHGEDPAEERGIVPRGDGSWLVAGWVSTDDLKRLLQVRELPDEEEADYHTAAGFLIHLSGHIPAEGEDVTWEGWHLELVDADGPRLDKLLVRRVEAAEEPASADMDEAQSATQQEGE